MGMGPSGDAYSGNTCTKACKASAIELGGTCEKESMMSNKTLKKERNPVGVELEEMENSLFAYS